MRRPLQLIWLIILWESLQETSQHPGRGLAHKLSDGDVLGTLIHVRAQAETNGLAWIRRWGTPVG